MQASLFLSLFLGAAAEAQLIFGNPACYADNCARAITGSSGDSSQVAAHASDCSSFMETTITVPEETVTICDSIVNDTKTVSPTFGVARRQQYYPSQIPPQYGPLPPQAIPPYVPATCGEHRYTSACVCWNVTAPTKTVCYGVSDPWNNLRTASLTNSRLQLKPLYVL